MNLAKYRAKLIDRQQIAAQTITLKFERPPEFSFLAGQFIQFLIPTSAGLVPRSYSLSSIPADAEIEFCLKILPGGLASTFLGALSVGDEVELRGPTGRFVCTNETVNHSYIATGAGLAPIFSIIRDELEIKKTNQPIRLVFGVRSDNNVFWLDRLESLVARFPNFSYKLTVSQPTGAWVGNAGRVTKYLPVEITGTDFFLCGNGEMVKEVRQILIERGVTARDIYFEIF